MFSVYRSFLSNLHIGDKLNKNGYFLIVIVTIYSLRNLNARIGAKEIVDHKLPKSLSFVVMFKFPVAIADKLPHFVVRDFAHLLYLFLMFWSFCWMALTTPLHIPFVRLGLPELCCQLGTMIRYQR
jgi:hypothetical protein